MISKNFYTILILFTLVGFVLRIEVCRELLNNDVQVSRPSGGTDMYTYKDFSTKIVKGNYKQSFYYQPFYYAIFLPFIKKICGIDNLWAILIVQSFLGALTIYLAGLSSYILFSYKAALITAFLLTFSKILVFYTPYHLIATLQAFWLSLILYLGLIVLKSPSCKRWIILGFITSLAILTRGNVWFFVPGFILMAGLDKIKNNKEKTLINKPGKMLIVSKKNLLFLICFLFAMLLPQTPFIYKNTQILGKLTGPSTAAKAVLGLGNTPEAPPGGRNPGTGPGPMEYPATYHTWVSGDIYSKIWNWFKTSPLAFLELQARKMLLFWDYREIPNNIALEYQGEKSTTLKNITILPTSLLLFLALSSCLFFTVEFLRSIKQTSVNSKYINKGVFLVIYMIFAYWLATSAFYILARFRLPMLPLAGVISGGFLSLIPNMLKEKKDYIRLKIVGVSLFFSLFTVYAAYDCYRFNYEAFVMKHIKPDGVRSELENKTIMYLDNGPVTFGGWEAFEMKKFLKITKTFVLQKKDVHLTGELVLPFVFEKKGRLILKVNGEEQILNSEKAGFKEQSLKMKFVNNSTVNIEVIKSSTRVFCFVDTQRDYSRTDINLNNTPKGELVCKLLLKRGKNDK